MQLRGSIPSNLRPWLRRSFPQRLRRNGLGFIRGGRLNRGHATLSTGPARGSWTVAAGEMVHRRHDAAADVLLDIVTGVGNDPAALPGVEQQGIKSGAAALAVQLD